MNLNNLYNFKNAVRHFVDIVSLEYPDDVENFNTRELCWTMPISFNVQKGNGKYRTLKIPNVLNFVRAFHYYSGLPYFDNVQGINPAHSRMTVNFDTGDFVAGEYDAQLNDDFMNLCLYDNLIKLDIKDFYGKLYSHYLPKGELQDNVFTSLNNGRTGGIIMGNYLSLYFAENALKKISDDFEMALEDASVNCHFEYFSDDFYIFCNRYDNEKIRKLFSQVLVENDYEGNEQKIAIEDYESYNIENLLTRYWKAIMRHWNVEVIKDFERQEQIGARIQHKLSFLNQLIYRLASVKKERNKQSLIRNFFKTKHFRETDFEEYDIEEYDYHQLCFLLKTSPESLLYTSDIFNDMSGFDNQKIKIFLKARYKEALISAFHRMAVLNPQLLDKVCTETDGIVLIDEIDLHLHPTWQQRILEDLTDIFPKLQFVVSTHAPSVISSAKSENLLILDQYEVYEPSGEVYGRDTSTIVRSVMNALERPKSVKKLFADFYHAIDESDVEKAEYVLNHLKAIMGNDEPEISSCNIKLKLLKMRTKK